MHRRNIRNSGHAANPPLAMSKHASNQEQTAAAPTEASWRSWLEGELGSQVRDLEAALFESYCRQMFGYRLLRIGCLGEDQRYLDACPIRTKLVLSRESVSGGSALGLPEQLPIAGDSIDAVVLPHALDFTTDPRQVLREVERVLVPEGRLLISGFNPLSLWGVRRMFGGREVPWQAHFIPYPRMHDWLSLLGFQVENTETLFFRPPLHNAGVMRRLTSMDRLGERFWPWLAGVYVVLAIKRVSRVTPIGLRWSLRQHLLRSRLVEPSTRGMGRDGRI